MRTGHTRVEPAEGLRGKAAPHDRAAAHRHRAGAVLTVLILLRRDTFASPYPLAVCLLVFAVAHGSQFAVNVPMALRESRGLVPLWPVLRGWMLIIFVGDGLLAVANGALAAHLW
jgi:hypothetical protein